MRKFIIDILTWVFQLEDTLIQVDIDKLIPRKAD